MRCRGVAMQIRNPEQGFVLVTSLVFLVVITLLAVSAINSSTIQERMASNQREKSRALQAADAALRHGESLFNDSKFDTQQRPGKTVDVENPNSDSDDGEVSVKLWVKDKMLADDNNAAAFLDPAIWTDDKTLGYDMDKDKSAMNGAGLAPTRYYVEDYACLRNNLSAEAGAYCDGSIVYRITARATGQNPAAVAVTQSLYEKQY
jgi:type IV pilus assembly protein PilX